MQFLWVKKHLVLIRKNSFNQKNIRVKNFSLQLTITTTTTTTIIIITIIIIVMIIITIIMIIIIIIIIIIMTPMTVKTATIGPFIRRKIRRVLHRTRLKVTRPTLFRGVPSYFEALWYPRLYFYRKSNT